MGTGVQFEDQSLDSLALEKLHGNQAEGSAGRSQVGICVHPSSCLSFILTARNLGLDYNIMWVHICKSSVSVFNFKTQPKDSNF